MTTRLCGRPGCAAEARASLTFAYDQRTAVLGPLAPARAATGSDLCAEHCASLKVPQGWEMVRLPLDRPDQAAAKTDLKALAEAIRQAAGLRPAGPPAAPQAAPEAAPAPVDAGAVVTLAARRHLRVVADPQRSLGGRRAG
ncbi:MAG: DUF3499 domain-containing protein [Propionibacteriaceae bacterium]|nr:DUF3499 domain-containing protein [Propionibacteriaceae bacterium]